MSTIPVRELKSRLPHYKRLLILSEIGGKTPHEIAVRVDASGSYTAADVATDLARLERTVETGDLPETLAEEFKEVYGTRRQLEEMEGITVSGGACQSSGLDPRQQRIDAYVDRSLEADQTVGFGTDTLSEWFYRRLHRERLTDGRS